MKDIILIGYGGHARSMSDSVVRQGQYRIVGFTAPERPQELLGHEWLGTDECLAHYFSSGVRNACICIGYLGRGDLRDSLYSMVKRIGFQLPEIIDPSAVIAGDVPIGEGTFIGKNAVVNSGSRIGKMCIVNTCALVEHDSMVGDFTHLAVRATLCGGVKVSDHCLIGAASTLVQCVQIGSHSIIGAGAAVIKDIPQDCVVAGVPAQIIKQGGRA